MIGALIALTLVVIVVSWALRRILVKPPLVIACSAIVVAATWATRDLNVLLAGLLISGVVVAAVEGFVRKHTVEAP